MGTIASSGSTSIGSAPAAEATEAEPTPPEATPEESPAPPEGAAPAVEDAASDAAVADAGSADGDRPDGDGPDGDAVDEAPATVTLTGDDAATETADPTPEPEAPAAEASEPVDDEPVEAEPVDAEPVGEEPVAEATADEEPPPAVEPEAPAATASALWDLPTPPAEPEQPSAEEPAAAAEKPVEEPVEEEAAEPAPAAEAEPTPAPATTEAPVAPAPPAEVPAEEPPRRRAEPAAGAAPAKVTAGLPRPPGPGRAARRLAAERAAAQAAIEKALAERAAADRAVEEQVARERARRPAVPIPAVVPEQPRAEAPARGPAVVVATSHRLRRRIIGGLVALVVLVAAGVTAFVVTHRDIGPTATTAAPVPDARLPTVADPPPVLAALSAQAPRPDPQVLARTLAPLLSASALGPGVGAEVVDAATGTVLLDQDGGTPATPASTAKLLTSTAVLTTVDPENTLTTKVVAGSAPGEVVLVGGGDPTLTRADTSPNYPGAASVKNLAAQVRAALPGTTVTRVVVDGSLFSGPLTAAGWQPSDAPSTYASPITAAMVDGGRTSATSGNRSGTPATDAGQALAAALGVPRATVTLGTAPAGARTLGSVQSAPIARIVEQALSQSDNVLAEALARQVALARHLPVTFEGAAQGILAALRQDGVDVSGVTMVDGSGLSRTDAVPPAVLASVLTRTASGGLPRAAAILSGLAVAGYDGTLADRGDSDPSTAPGSVRAKTGTLLGVHGLAGTAVTTDGRLLVFAVLADHSTSGDAAAEGALDQVATTLAGCGCR